jgi:sugar lactone lactonase YvrE
MKRWTAQLMLDAKAELGEGPVWDATNEDLLWVDITSCLVHRYHPATGETVSIDVGQPVGSIVIREEGGAVVGLKNGIHLLDWESGELTLISDPEAHLPDNRFNDGKCDPAGRFWTGTMLPDEIDRMGSLYCLDTDRSCKQVLTNIGCSNGLAWSPDQKTMYYIDSPDRTVDALDYEVTTGEVGNRRTVIRIPEGGGVPDGMAIDLEGMLWVAQWDGYQVGRWNPATGELIGIVDVPVARVTSCAFGGPELTELYITTASIDQSEEALASQPHAGGIFRINAGVRGLPVNGYRG